MGRPHQLTSDPVKGRKLIKKICALIRRGHYGEQAARNCGIKTRTYYEWRAQGLEDVEEGRDTLFSEFYEAVEDATAKAEDFYLKVIEKNIPEDPRLALEVMSRRWPHRWGRPRDRVVLPSDAGSSAKPLAEMLADIATGVNGRPLRGENSSRQASGSVDEKTESNPAA